MDGEWTHLTHVELREHVEALIRHEREMREGEARRAAEALRIQAQEYERRLEALNHAHAQLMAMQATYLPRREFGIYQEGVGKRRDDMERWQRDVMRQLDAYRGALAAGAVGLTLLGLALRFVP